MHRIRLFLERPSQIKFRAFILLLKASSDQALRNCSLAYLNRSGSVKFSHRILKPINKFSNLNG